MICRQKLLDTSVHFTMINSYTVYRIGLMKEPSKSWYVKLLHFTNGIFQHLIFK